MRNLDRWSEMVSSDDVRGLRRVMTGLDTDSIQMREVSPFGGLLSEVMVVCSQAILGTYD